MSGALEFVSLFMESNAEITQSLHKAAFAFGVEDKKADFL